MTKSNNNPRTKKHYQTAINILKNWETINNKRLEFSDINMNFYTDFIDFMQDKTRNGVKNYTKNTIGSVIKEIKVFMNNANDIGLTVCTGHLHRKFITLEETSDSIYLNTEELMKIYNLELTNITLERVRDLFIIGCFTGLRYSDLAQITPENFVNKGRDIKIKTEKTGVTVIIPLHEAIIKILEKRNGRAPEPYRDQPMNRYLKVIARLAGLTEKVSKSVTRGGVRVTTIYFKWELVTVHTARRSFATNAFIARVPPISIMKITGHKTERAFLKYIKVSEEQNADLIRDHEYFKLKAI
jgi:integrase